MESNWERSIPIKFLYLKDIKEIFKTFRKGEGVKGYKLITIGGRNSNYLVETTDSRYVLRICSQNDLGYKNEIIAYKILRDKINIPSLLYVDRYKENRILVYQYIKGYTLQDKELSNNLLSEIANTVAIIHNISKEEYSKFDMLRYPKFSKWFSIFLGNENLRKRLSSDKIKRINSFLLNIQDEIRAIDKYKGFIHGDFRPSNMIITEDYNIYYVDWEYSNEGHILGDIGQVFRLIHKDIENKKIVFEKSYNNIAKKQLPDNWFRLCKIRDLANLLQLLGGENRAPIKYNHLITLIDKTIKDLE